MNIAATADMNGAQVPMSLTVADSLLIAGPAGAPGGQGPQGIPGPQGVPGTPSGSGKPVIAFGSDGGWATVAIGTGAEWFIYTVLRAVLDVGAGEVLDIYGEGQVRNDTGWNVELAQALFVRDCPGGIAPATYDADFDTGRITPINGWNVSPAEHYGRFSKASPWVSPSAKKVSVELRIRARSSSATGGGGSNLAVQQSQGLLAIKRWA